MKKNNDIVDVEIEENLPPTIKPPRNPVHKRNNPHIHNVLNENIKPADASRFQCFSNPPPPGMSDQQFEDARKHAISTNGTVLSEVAGKSGVYWYLIGNSFAEISKKLQVSESLVCFTSLVDDWYGKKVSAINIRASHKLQLADEAAADMISDAIIATSVLYQKQLQEVIRDPSKAASCPLIPKNIKEMSVLLQMMSALQGISQSNQPSVQVNIANVPGAPQVTTSSSHQQLSSGSEQVSKTDILKFLKEAKKT